MPQRLLRPTITSSKRWNRLDWIVQSFFVRLLTIVDDYGRHEADLRLLRSACLPLGCPNGEDLPLLPNDSGLPSIAGICQSLSDNGMVLFYRVGDTDYLQVARWKERVRTDSKCPPPNDGQMSDKCPSIDRQMTASPPAPAPAPAPGEVRGQGRDGGQGFALPPLLKSLPTEPPPGFPRSEEEAAAATSGSGVPPEFAITKWNQTVGLGWKDWKGVPVKSFVHWCKSEWESKGKTAFKPKKSNGTPDRDKLETKQAKLREAVCRLEAETFYPEGKTTENLAALEKARKDLKEVNQQLE